MSTASLGCALVLTVASVAWAQDPAIVDGQHYKVVLDNERTRVFRVVVPAGEGVVRHGHPDAIMIPLTNPPVAALRGLDESAIPAAIFIPAQTHGGDGVSDVPVDFVYVELKGDARPTATLPGTRPDITSTRVVWHAKADAFRATIGTGFREPAGEHDYDQLLVALRDSNFTLTVDGRRRTRGSEVTWRASAAT